MSVSCSGFVQLRWINLNPLELVKKMKDKFADGDMMEAVLLRSGISSGYQEKPCIDPSDPDCPDTAPNKASQRVSECIVLHKLTCVTDWLIVLVPFNCFHIKLSMDYSQFKYV